MKHFCPTKTNPGGATICDRKEAAQTLNIAESELEKTVCYSEAKFKFGRTQAAVSFTAHLTFLAFGGLGWAEYHAKNLSDLISGGDITTGLFFFVILGILAQMFSLPFTAFHTFIIEGKFGFNKQTVKGFVVDLLKGTLVASILGCAILSVILWIMQVSGTYWWLYAWSATTLFSLITAWIYPTLLAPIFNKFRPLEDGELKQQIIALAQKTGFPAGELFVMDASRRSRHGNAYFTGLFGRKRIVLFDTLIADLHNDEIIAVLAHELGHFKLHHVRKGVIRGTLLSLLVFAGIGYALPQATFYSAFFLDGVSNFGGLVVFSMWFSLIEFYLQPLETLVSRKYEFQADEFAKAALGTGASLAAALKKLREKSSVMPIAHPWYSSMYYSHPPMLERIRALQTTK